MELAEWIAEMQEYHLGTGNAQDRRSATEITESFLG